METTPCPDCGTQVNPRGMAAHRRGQSCACEMQARDLRELGFVRCGTPGFSGRIRKAGLEVRSASTGFIAGFVGRRSKTTTQLWAPAWAVALCSVGVDTIELAKLSMADEAFRKSVESAYRLHGAEGVRPILQAAAS